MEDTIASLAVTLIAIFCAVIIAVGVGSGLWRGARKLYRKFDDWRWQRRVRRLVTDDDTWCPQCVEEIRAQMPKAHIVPLGRPVTCEKHAATASIGRTDIAQFGGVVESSDDPMPLFQHTFAPGAAVSTVKRLPDAYANLKVLHTRPMTAESGGLN